MLASTKRLSRLFFFFLSQHICRDKTFVSVHICRDKSIVATNICLSRQTFCRDKHIFVVTKDVLVATKSIIVAVPANDRFQRLHNQSNKICIQK